MTPTEELERGRLAQEVIDNPAYQGALTRLQTEIFSQWQKETAPADREWLWALMQASKRFAKVLEETMQTGVLRSKQIAMEQSRTARLRKKIAQF